MFTPQPYAGYVGTPRRTDNGAGGQVPSAGGSSFLFPQSATAPRTSPGFGPSTPTQGNTPFGMPTPGVPLPSGMQPGMQSAMQPRLPGAHSNSLLSPLSAAVPPQPLFSPQGRMLPAAGPESASQTASRNRTPSSAVTKKARAGRLSSSGNR